MPGVTIYTTDAYKGDCPHCGTRTTLLRGGSGVPTPPAKQISSRPTKTSACLQCIADGGNCCSLAPLSRWD